ncbi:thioredoxin domain-containing protein [Modicisalibacter muralis]|uniref:hypothetical protein n=1 Tax=Modicisalibacter muralis TaxID=119000 RepID=UPI001FE0B49A|nr:hypothetical protein [Halomonas muralis]
MKLYGTPPTRALRVIWLLNELGLEYEMLPVDISQGENQQQDFLTLNPAAQVPRRKPRGNRIGRDPTLPGRKESPGPCRDKRRYARRYPKMP